MKLEVQIGGRARELEARRVGGRWLWQIDGKPLEADTAEVARGIYSILIGGRSFEMRVEESGEGLRVFSADREFPAEVIDPRNWRGRQRHGAVEAEGRQQVLAPMPGKVVRVLVKAGDAEIGRASCRERV